MILGAVTEALKGLKDSMGGDPAVIYLNDASLEELAAETFGNLAAKFNCHHLQDWKDEVRAHAIRGELSLFGIPVEHYQQSPQTQ